MFLFVRVAFEPGGGGGSDQENTLGPTLRAQEGGLLSIGKNLLRTASDAHRHCCGHGG